MRSLDDHFFSPGPKRILALDGGGVRGIISIAFLEEIEATLKKQNGEQCTLVDYFDLIGGTSTGSIIAGALALGFSATKVRDFYFDLAPRVFRRNPLRILGLRPKFDEKHLAIELDNIGGDRTMDSPDIRTGVCVIAKRIDTHSPWFITNNPRSKYWNADPKEKSQPNSKLRLVDLVRASTAAPHFFSPKAISVAEGQPAALFIDGSISPFNNPALALFMIATSGPYGFDWKTGEDNLLIVSIGAGGARQRYRRRRSWYVSPAELAVRSLSSIIFDCDNQTLALMQWMARSDTPWPINSEIGALEGRQLGDGPLLTFQRYDLRLELDWLHKNGHLDITEKELKSLQQLDAAEAMPRAYEIAREAAARQVRDFHLPPALGSGKTRTARRRQAAGTG